MLGDTNHTKNCVDEYCAHIAKGIFELNGTYFRKFRRTGQQVTCTNDEVCTKMIKSHF